MGVGWKGTKGCQDATEQLLALLAELEATGRYKIADSMLATVKAIPKTRTFSSDRFLDIATHFKADIYQGLAVSAAHDGPQLITRRSTSTR